MTGSYREYLRNFAILMKKKCVNIILDFIGLFRFRSCVALILLGRILIVRPMKQPTDENTPLFVLEECSTAYPVVGIDQTSFRLLQDFLVYASLHFELTIIMLKVIYAI